MQILRGGPVTGGIVTGEEGNQSLYQSCLLTAALTAAVTSTVALA